MATPRVLSTAAHCLLVMLLCTLFPRITQAQDVTLTPSGKVLSGADEYRRYCAQCHGMSGKGDGPVAGELKVPPQDLTLLSKDNGGQFPFQRVYDSISGKNQLKAHGTLELPSFIFSSRGQGTNMEWEPCTVLTIRSIRRSNESPIT